MTANIARHGLLLSAILLLFIYSAPAAAGQGGAAPVSGEQKNAPGRPANERETKVSDSMDNSFYKADRFADIEVLRYRVPGFEGLSLNRKLLIYHLSEAALAGRDILYDQNNAGNLALRKCLEEIYLKYGGDRGSAEFKAFEKYLKQVWFSNGVHHHYSTIKHSPEFSQEYFDRLLAECSVKADSELLHKLIFDPAFDAKRVNQADGEDVILTSASNYYRGVSQKEAEAFYAAKGRKDDPEPLSYGLNSRLEKQPDGSLAEVTWKADGEYGPAIREIVRHLEAAAAYAENEAQKKVIELLISFYRSGSLETFDEYSIAWVADTLSKVDFVNGFIETYGDPLGIKASWEGIVNFRDEEATARTLVISENAQWFEDHSPVDPRFKKDRVRGVSAKVITVCMLGGDCYPATPIGINLPNANWIRQAHGSKSVTIENIMRAYDEAARGNGFAEEFYSSDEERERWYRHGFITDIMHTDLHECLGHGSGRLLDGVSQDALKAYGACLEEARADLFALYYIADDKMTELGLLPDGDAYKASYYHYLLNGLMTQLVRIPRGEQIEEAHMRNRQLIAAWVFERAKAGGAAAMVRRDGKTYLEIYDYPALRSLIGELLAEVQRIKSEGDFEAGRKLVETYGIVPDPELHEEALERYGKLDIAPYKGFVNPSYELVRDKDGNITDVKIKYGEGYAEQMLRYSAEYSFL